MRRQEPERIRGMAYVPASAPTRGSSRCRAAADPTPVKEAKSAKWHRLHAGVAHDKSRQAGRPSPRDDGRGWSRLRQERGKEADTADD